MAEDVKPDFVTVASVITEFVQNERVSSFNEGVDTILASIRNWIRCEYKMDPCGDNVPDILDDFMNQFRTRVGITDD